MRRSAEGCLVSQPKRRKKSANSKIYLKDAMNQGQIYTVKTLENLSLDVISLNVDLLDSLVGLPEIIGKLIFDHVVAYISSQNCYPVEKVKNLFKVFDNAYKGLLLEQMTFRVALDETITSRSLIVAECTNFVEEFSNLKCLDLSDCSIGTTNPILDHIAKIKSLEFLNLSGNYVDKEFLRRLTITLKFYDKGLTNLKVLDLSFNSRVDYTCVDLLTRFKTLEALNLTGTTLECEPQIETMAKKMNFSINRIMVGPGAEEKARELYDFNIHENKGWASEFLVRYLVNTYAKKPTERTKLQDWRAPRGFYGKHFKPDTFVPFSVAKPVMNYSILLREK